VTDAEELLSRALIAGADLTGEDGEDEKQDEVEGLLRRAAAHGLPRAMSELGAFLWYVREDDEAAREWLLRAAAAGEADAMNLLGDIHDFRAEPDEAIAWYEKAAALGDEQAAGSLAFLRNAR
jgi:TPR repeat protein